MKPLKNKKIPVYETIPLAALNGKEGLVHVEYGEFETIQPSSVPNVTSLKIKGARRYYYMNNQMAKLYKVFS